MTASRKFNPLGSSHRRTGGNKDYTFSSTARDNPVFSSEHPSTRDIKYTSSEMMEARTFTSEPLFSSKPLSTGADVEGLRALRLLRILLPIGLILVVILAAVLVIRCIMKGRSQTVEKAQQVTQRDKDGDVEVTSQTTAKKGAAINVGGTREESKSKIEVDGAGDGKVVDPDPQKAEDPIGQ